MLKNSLFFGFLLLISACNPDVEKSALSNARLLAPQCIESQSQCEISTDLTTFSVKFSQHQLSNKVKTELPFTIELSQVSKQNKPLNISKVSAYLEGKDMFMGKVPIFFEQTDKNTVYLAQSLLASCSEEQMVWRLWITVVIADQTQTFFVDFTSQRL